MATAAPATFAAIDVGTNAVRLKLARRARGGALTTVHEERDPIRPGEGVFKTGSVPPAVADRLINTLRQYAAICSQHKARVRAVATSAVREAKNGAEILRRVRDEAGVELEIISGREEARLICLGVLAGTPRGVPSLLVDIGGGSTEVAVASGEVPSSLWSLSLGAVRLTEIFESGARLTPKQLKLMREYAAQVAEEGLPPRLHAAPRRALGSSGTIRAVVGFAAQIGTGRATLGQITAAVDALAKMGRAGREKRFEPARAEIIVAGAVVLEAVAARLHLQSIAVTDRGLRDGVLVDLVRRERLEGHDPRLANAAISVGRGFHFDEGHAKQVARLALSLYDGLQEEHGLPPAARGYLEAAALLHDIGHAVGLQRHHRHTAYLIQHTDIPGLADHERQLVAAVARYHRRSAPEMTHPGLAELPVAEARMVRKLSTLLRIADALDRSHHQPVGGLTLRVDAKACRVSLATRGAGPANLDLELWDVEQETALFRRVFGKNLVVESRK